MRAIGLPETVRAALKDAGVGDKKLSAPVLGARLLVGAKTGTDVKLQEGEIAIVVPKTYSTKAFERYLAFPKGHQVKAEKSGEVKTEHYSWGCQIDPGASSGFRPFFLGMVKGDDEGTGS